MKKNYSLALMCLLFSMACSKSDSPAPATKTKTELLTAQDWIRISQMEKGPNETSYTEKIQFVPACSRDDRYVFRTNGSFEQNEGATKCSASNPQIVETGTWSFTQNETVMILQGSSLGQRNLNIDDLSATSLAFSYSAKDATGLTYQVKQVFSH